MRRCRCRGLGEAAVGWERFLQFAGLYTWDYVIETGLGDPTKAEEQAILQLGYYDKAITPASVRKIARGESWRAEAPYTITERCVDGISEVPFKTLPEVAKFVKAHLGADARNKTPDGFGTDYCNYDFHGFTIQDILSSSALQRYFSE